MPGFMTTPTGHIVPFPEPDTSLRATMWHDQSLVLTGNHIVVTVDTAQRHAFIANQSAAANGDVSTNGCYLAAGTYTLNVLGVSGPLRAKLDIALDGLTIVSGQDWYAAALTHEVIKSTVGVVVPYSGWHTVKLTTNGRNALATGWVMSLTYIEFRPAAD